VIAGIEVDAAVTKAAGMLAADKIVAIIGLLCNSSKCAVDTLSVYLVELQGAEQPDHLMIGLVKYYISQSGG
jgi:hypothetical protein